MTVISSIDLLQIDTQAISFTNESRKFVTFADAFRNVPMVACFASSNVNVWADNTSITGSFVNTSENFTGTVYVKTIGEKT